MHSHDNKCINSNFTISMASFSPSMPPAASHNDVLLSSDRRFALHGEIMMLVVIMLFIVFLISVILFLLIKHPYNVITATLDQSVEPKRFPFPIFDRGHSKSWVMPLHRQEDRVGSPRFSEFWQNWTNHNSPRYTDGQYVLPCGTF
ncbi:Regulator of telomere elongation helicase [Actinidia chinensis var. chinensis]|uniref:Regulator of telomere elongation helicase n=1 Tax=Actinidia chinensis var. chinensis TaxID=1590841 RepID=A0A2R6R8F7_ACTCC|nr:Regulator of telomere elongation helicase [Actinidia chinensis var. chinensis]